MISLVLTLALLGFVCWLVITYIPMPQPFKTGILVLVVILVILYLIRILGIADIPVR